MAELAAKLVNYISSFGPYAQVGLGAGSGWLTGFSAMKIGKFMIAVLGGAIIIIKIAEIQGFIDIDWVKIKHNVRNITLNNNLTLDKAEYMASDIQNFVVSFIGGGLMGIGFA